jgi:BirA family biotin operon repressor/biotin-[acetyl-CoA-carboxylase] ligase
MQTQQFLEDRIIHHLINASGHVSGEEIAHELRISRTAIWNHVNNLKKIGFRIESQPHLGHRLVALPDKLLPALVTNGLDTESIGKKVVHYARIASSNDEAENLARAGERDGTVIVAEEQTSGKGRIGRVWRSPRGKGVYLSIILRPELPPARVSFLTLCSAISASEAIQRCAGVRAFVKWPNDVLVSGKKVCGILTELATEADRINYAIVGVGINVNQAASDLAGLPMATSLKIERGEGVSRLELARAFLESMDDHYDLLLAKQYGRIIDKWLDVSETIGKRIMAQSLSGEKWEGLATGLDEDGCLLLRLDSGVIKRITGGDVEIQ